MNGRKLTRLHFPEANFSRVVPGPLENSPKGAFKRSTVLVWFAKRLIRGIDGKWSQKM